MNKWSLRFPDKVLEANYQLKTQTTVRYPVFCVLNATGILDMVFAIVNNLVNQEIANVGVASFLLLLSVLVGLIIRKHHKFVNTGLLFLMVTYIILSTVLLDQNSKANIATQAYCLMICNCLILCIQDFTFGMFQILCTALAVFILQFFFIGLSSMTLFLPFIWLSLIMMYCIYKLQQQTRSFFLLSQKDSNIQTILSQIATRPFVIFDFDQEQFQFKQLYNHQITLPEVLNSEFKWKSFGDFIYQRQKENAIVLDEVHKQDFIIKLQNKLIEVNYSEFYLSKKTFMIVLNQVETYKSETLAKLQISAFITQNLRALVMALQVNQKKGSQMLAKIILNNLIVQKTFMYQTRPHFTFVNISRTLKKQLKLLQLACKKIKSSLRGMEELQIITIKPLLCLIIIEILTQFKDCSTLFCSLHTYRGSLTIKFHSNQFFAHKPLAHIDDGLKYIISRFNQVAQGKF